VSKIELEELVTKAMSLLPGARAELAELLIQSLEETHDPEVRDAWVSEIHRKRPCRSDGRRSDDLSGGPCQRAEPFADLVLLCILCA